MPANEWHEYRDMLMRYIAHYRVERDKNLDSEFEMTRFDGIIEGLQKALEILEMD